MRIIFYYPSHSLHVYVSFMKAICYKRFDSVLCYVIITCFIEKVISFV